MIITKAKSSSNIILEEKGVIESGWFETVKTVRSPWLWGGYYTQLKLGAVPKRCHKRSGPLLPAILSNIILNY